MEISLFLAKVLGLYMLVMAIFMYSRKVILEKLFATFAVDSMPLVLSGVLSLLVGLMIIVGHPYFGSWRILVTLLGYAAVGKGIVSLFAPEWILRLIAYVMIEKNYYITNSIILFLGLLLSLLGFFGS